MATFEASELARLRGAGLVGNQLTQPHPNVMCSTNGSGIAPLTNNCDNPFGLELVLGHALAKSLVSPMSLIKVAQGGTTVQVDWRNPRRGEPVGEQHKQLSARITSLVSTPASVHPDCVSRKCQCAALVFFRGENDSFDATSAAVYEQNLRDMVADVRAEIGAADLPVAVVREGKWAKSLPHGGTVAAAQQAFVKADVRSRLVDTTDLSGFYHCDPAAQLVIGERVANAAQQLMSARP